MKEKAEHLQTGETPLFTPDVIRNVEYLKAVDLYGLGTLFLAATRYGDFGYPSNGRGRREGFHITFTRVPTAWFPNRPLRRITWWIAPYPNTLADSYLRTALGIARYPQVERMVYTFLRCSTVCSYSTYSETSLDKLLIDISNNCRYRKLLKRN